MCLCNCLIMWCDQLGSNQRQTDYKQLTDKGLVAQ